MKKSVLCDKVLDAIRTQVGVALDKGHNFALTMRYQDIYDMTRQYIGEICGEAETK